MTEAEWAASNDAVPMLVFLEGRITRRQEHLFACACCRRIWHLLSDEPCRNGVEIAERLADGLASREEWAAHWEEAVEKRQLGTYGINAAYNAGYPMPLGARHALTSAGATQAREPVTQDGEWLAGVIAERTAQTVLLRDIFGNPFRPVAADPPWLTSTVVTLAEGIYAERAFDRLPILADALQDAGCENADILAHCRNDGPHVRGCWVVDLLLRKE
jgi:hypothetical protein